MFRLLIIFLAISYNSHSQDTLVIDDGSIWWAKKSCSVDYRCYENINEVVETYCSDSVTITSIELKENVFERSTDRFTECRIQRLADFLRGKHSIEVENIIATPIEMNASEMRQAIAEQNFRTIIIVFGKVEPLESL